MRQLQLQTGGSMSRNASKENLGLHHTGPPICPLPPSLAVNLQHLTCTRTFVHENMVGALICSLTRGARTQDQRIPSRDYWQARRREAWRPARGCPTTGAW